MSAPVILAVGVLGGLGAVLRFWLDGAVAVRVGRDFPYGTLTVNLLGCLLVGVFVGAALDGDAYRLVATGLVGAFTTFSTWALESHRVSEDGRIRLGLANFAVSLVVGVAVVWAGRHLGSLL